MERRTFLKLAGGAALTPALASFMSSIDDAQAFAAPSKVKSKTLQPVTLGFIALTDCASLVMAKELGYFEERGLDVTLQKQASWPATRDALLTNQIDGAHCLFSMPLSVATGIGGTEGNTSLKIAMVLNNNGQAITLKKDFGAAGYGNLAKARKVLEAKTPTMAMTFPGGTHDMWLRYWLRATGADESAVNIIPIPPPQMVANMSVGTMDGYCVGEPWNAVAVDQNIGFTTIASQDIWTNHPEKALVVSEQFATTKQALLEDVMAAALKASAWLDVRANRTKAASVLGVPEYVNATASSIEGRLAGNYQLGGGLGAKAFKDDYMTFFRNGEVNAPRAAHAIWFLAQYQRLGLLSTTPDYQKLVDAILLRDVYEKVAKAEKIVVPDDDMAPFTVKLDHATFDPAKPNLEVQTRMTTTTTPEVRPVAAPPLDPPGPSTGAAPPGPPRMHRWRERLLSAGFGLLGMAVFVAFWTVVSWRNPDVPGPLDAWEALRSLLADGFASSSPNGPGIMLQLGDSLELTVKGFGLAALVGIPVGLAAGGNQRIWQALNPLVQLLKPVSPLAWFPIGLVAFKDSPKAAVFVIFVTALWPIVLNTAVGASSVPSDQRNVAQVFRFGRRQYLRQIVIPHTMPSIITGLRLSMGIAWMVIVAVEMLSGGSGIGFFVWNSYNGGNLAAVMAAIVLIGVVGLALDNLFVFLGRRYTGEVAR